MMPNASACRRGLPRGALLCILAVAVPLLVWLEFGQPPLSADPRLDPVMRMALTRLLGAAVFFSLILSEGYRLLSPTRGFRPLGRFCLFFLPPLCVVINNFPLLALIRKEACILHNAPLMWGWFSLECLAIALFEEAAFRGFIFPMLAERRYRKRHGLLVSILLTSAVFALVHAVNLLQGGGVGAVLRQIGYSFLIGAMCSVVLIKTHNLWLCVLLHAVFDFGGKLIETMGTGQIWNTPTVVVTAVLAVMTTVYLTWQFFKTDPQSFGSVYPTPSEKEQHIGGTS